MDASESLLARVERFEDYCSQKRGLEGDIEYALARRDEKAVEDVEIAERELESTKRECAAIDARIEKARRWESSSTEGSKEACRDGPASSGVAVREGRPPFATITTPQSPVAQISQPGSSETVLPVTTPLIPTSIADSASFSVISSPEQSMTGTGSKSLEAPEDVMSDDFLTSLVQRYADLCHERHALQEEIEGKLERKERIAVEKLVCAKIALDTTRQNAVEIVAALMEASGGDTHIRLPTAEQFEKRSGSAHPSNVSELNYPSRSTPSLASYSRTSPGISTSSLPCHENAKDIQDPPPGSAPASLGSLPPLTLHLDLAKATTVLPRSITNPVNATKPKIAPKKSIKVEEWEAAIFRLYDTLMPFAIAARSAVTVSHLPWPVLEFKHDTYSPENITNDDIKQEVVADFIRVYCVWKGWSFQTGREKMKVDWESVEKEFPSTRKGRKRVEKVVKFIAGAI